MRRQVFFVFFCLSIGLILCEIKNEENSNTTNQREEDINIVQSQSESNILSRQKRMPVIGYLSMMLGLINTAMLIVSNVVINNSGTNPNNNFKKRSIADEDKENYHYSDLPPIDFELIAKEPRKVLSRQKRTFPVFGFLSFLMLLLNSTMLIQVRDFSSSFLTSCRKINSSLYFFSAKYQQQQQ